MRALITISTFSCLFLAGCGSEIGDSCTFDTDCSPVGDRVCDGTSPNGYCTIIGCDHDTCPDEAVCVRFFSAETTNVSCTPETEDNPAVGNATDDCTPDELCTLAGTCVPKLAEQRFCMRKCSSSGDCRDRYECRTRQLMLEHGGEPVQPPGAPFESDPQPFCAEAPQQLPGT